MKITIELSDAEGKALTLLARQRLRTVKNEAAHIIYSELIREKVLRPAKHKAIAESPTTIAAQAATFWPRSCPGCKTLFRKADVETGLWVFKGGNWTHLCGDESSQVDKLESLVGQPC